MGLTIGRLIAWLRRRRPGGPRVTTVRYYDLLTEVPLRLPPRVMALVRPDGHKKWAVFECPCGRGHRITLNLHQSRWPRWTVDVTPQGPTVAPSIHVLDQRGCHFLLRRGEVRWVKRRGRFRRDGRDA